MSTRTVESKRIRRDLDKLLAEVGERTGQTLAWDAADHKLIDMLCDHVDREVALSARLAEAEAVKTQIAISVELRLTQAGISRLLHQIRGGIPKGEAPKTLTSIKASRAATARWKRHAMRDNAIGG
jgi:hypothetical protein